jgi:hypothetical protein
MLSIKQAVATGVQKIRMPGWGPGVCVETPKVVGGKVMPGDVIFRTPAGEKLSMAQCGVAYTDWSQANEDDLSCPAFEPYNG